jgi:hypothetical protein
MDPLPSTPPLPAAQAPLAAANPPPLPAGPPPAPTTAPAQTGPLGEADLLLIRQAGERLVAIKKAARTASISAGVTLAIGICSLPFVVLSPSWDGALIAVGVCVVGLVERRGARRLRQADPSAARLLGRNQLAFLALIILYCAVQMIAFARGGTAFLLSPETRSAAADVPDIAKQLDSLMAPGFLPLLVYGFYGLVIVLSIFSQGGLALYYFTRRKRLEAFNRDTPDWVRGLLLGAAG